MLCVGGAGATAPDEANGEPIEIRRATGPIVIDGVTDEPSWDDATRFDIAYEVNPGDNVPPPVATEVRLTWNNSNVLVAFRCEDPDPRAIRARFTDRDRLFKDDWISIVIDTFNDQRRAYEFLINPLGVQMDALNDDVNRNYDTSWNAIWESAGRITATGWEVEIAIPFSQIRFQASDGPQIWGLDLVRSYPRVDRHHIGLFPRDRGNNSYLSQTVKIIGFDGATPGRNLEIVPTLTGVRSKERDDVPDGPLEVVDSTVDAGVSAAWGVTANATLAAAVNPDYSQVEADAVQLDINQTFALFFNETRPFFKVGADTFSTRLRLLHTRVIADPDLALKATAKTGANTFGVFTAIDSVTNIIVPGAEESDSATFEQRNTSSVGRYRYDFGRNSTIGAMVTDREGTDGYSNRVISLDARLRFTEYDSIWVNGAFSKTRYNTAMINELELEHSRAQGHALVASYNHTSRDWGAWLNYNDVDEGYRADLGFQPTVDYRAGGGGAERFWWGDGDEWFNRISAGAGYAQSQYQDGAFRSRSFETWILYEGPHQSAFSAGGVAGERAHSGEVFSTDHIWLNGRIDIGASLEMGIDSRFGDWIDFTHVRQAELTRISPWLNLRLGRHLELSTKYNAQSLDVAQGRLYRAKVAEVRAIWQFNLRSFIRAILQHTNIDRNVALYTDETDAQSRDTFVQLLYSYKLNPRTVVFAGYTEGTSQTEAFNATTVGRTVFAKLGYSLVF